MPQTVTDLGKLVKTKYPGSYDDMPDDQVGVAVKKRFPGAYEDFEGPLQGTRSFDTADPFAKVARSATPSAAAPRSYVPPATNWLNKPQPVQVQGMEKLGGAPPGPPVPPLPKPTWEQQLIEGEPDTSPDNAFLLSRKGSTDYGQKVANTLSSGVGRAARGIEGLAQPVQDWGRAGDAAMVPRATPGAPVMAKPLGPQEAEAAHELIGGAFDLAMPSVARHLALSPWKTAAALGVGIGAQKGTAYGLKKAGVNEHVADLAGDVAGIGIPAGLYGGFNALRDGAGEQAGIRGEYGRGGSPISDARARWQSGERPAPPAPPPPRAYPGVPPARPMPGQPLPGPRPVKSALDSAQVFQDDAVRQERRDSIPGPQPVKPAAESAEAFGPDVKVTGLLDLQNQIAKRLAGVEYGQLEAADRGAVDKLALEEQGKLKAQRAAQKAPVAPEPETGPPAPVEQAPAPEPPPTGERPGMWPPPVDMTNQRVPVPAPIEQVGDEGLARVAQIEAQGPKRAAAMQEMQKRGVPGPPPVRMEPMPRSAKESAEVFQNAPASIAERAEAFDGLPEPEPQKAIAPKPAEPVKPAAESAQTLQQLPMPKSASASAKVFQRVEAGQQPGAIQRFLGEEEGFQRVPTKQDLLDLKDDALKKWDAFQRPFREGATDRFAAQRDMEKAAARAGKPLTADESAYVGMRNYSGIGGKAEVRLDKLGETLRAADRDKLYDPMVNYALYERYEELHDRSIDRFPNGQTIHQIRTDKANLENALGPANLAKVKGYVDKLRGYSDDLLKEALDAGVISRGQYDGIRAKNEKFIPLHRMAYLAEEIEGGRGGNSNAFSVRGQDLYKHIQGSEREIVDPITAMIRNTYKTVSLIARNKVAQQVGALAARPEFKGLVEEMKPGQSKKPGTEAISALWDGKRVDYQVPKDVGLALKGMNATQVDIVTKAASAAGSMLRSGATSLNVAFLASNVVRDYQTATAVSKVGFTPVDWANGFWQAVAAKTGLFDDAVYKAYLESGGAMSGYFGGAKDLARSREDLTDGFVKKEVLPSFKSRRLGAAGKAVAGATIGGAVAGPVGTAVGAGTGLVLHTVHHLGELTELAPRLGVFMKSLEQGKSPEESGFNSRNATVDFSKSGNVLRTINQWVPFLNARLQGNINLFQAMRPSQVGSREMFGAMRSPKQVATWNMMKAGAMVGIPALATYLYNHRDEATTNVWNSVKEYEKRNNFILIFGDHQDEQGRYTQAIKIPKGDVKAFANPIEAALEYSMGKDPKSLGRLAVEFGSDISPVDFEKDGKVAPSQLANEIPPTAKGLLEGMTNMNFYTGSQLVRSETMRKASPEKQYTDRTSNFGKAVGKTLGVAPIKVDNFMTTQFGGVGGQITGMSGSKKTPAGFNPGVKQVVRRYVGAQGNSEDKQREALDAIETKHADATLDKGEKAEDITDKIDAMKPEERAAFVQQMIASGEMDEGMFKAVKSSIEGRRMGLLPIERTLKSQPLAVRSEYIANELRSANTPERKQQIVQRYIEKKIMTEEVFRQVVEQLKR